MKTEEKNTYFESASEFLPILEKRAKRLQQFKRMVIFYKK